MTPPIRFLAATIGSWACVRGAMLVPWPADPQAPGPAAAAPVPTAQTSSEAVRHARFDPVDQRVARGALPRRWRTPRRAPAAPAMSVQATLTTYTLSASASPKPQSNVVAAPLVQPTFLPLDAKAPLAVPGERSVVLSERRPSASRWSLSAWVYARRREGAALVPGGLLGGSQLGARLRFHLSAPLSLSARVSAPLRRPRGAELAVGAEWQPARSVLRILAERRQALGSEGRNAFSLTLHGGASAVSLPAGFRLDSYAQAGVVGARSRELFADGALRATRPVIGGLSLGAGAWGAAQPGVSRLDVGPSATLRMPTLSATLSADWRFRVAGDARPGSGPALTLSTDF